MGMPATSQTQTLNHLVVGAPLAAAATTGWGEVGRARVSFGSAEDLEAVPALALLRLRDAIRAAIGAFHRKQIGGKGMRVRGGRCRGRRYYWRVPVGRATYDGYLE